MGLKGFIITGNKPTNDSNLLDVANMPTHDINASDVIVQ